MTDLRTYLADHLEVEYMMGALASHQHPYERSWRSLPYSYIAQIDAEGMELHLRDRAPLSIPAGSLVVVPEFVEHRMVSVAGAAPELGEYWAMMRFRILGTIDLLSLFDFPAVLQTCSLKNAHQLIEQLSKLSESSDPFIQKLKQQGLAHDLLAKILGANAGSDMQQDRLLALQRLQPVIKYIQNNLGAQMDRQSLARQVDLAASRFHELFKDCFRVAPMTYVNRLRLQQAAHMLRSTNDAVSKIGQSCGFPDPFHFSRSFKDVYGKSPKFFRKSAVH